MKGAGGNGPGRACSVLSAVALSLSASPGRAHDGVDNVFLFITAPLTLLAVKWACGGDPEADLAGLDRLIEAFPEDAIEADITRAIDHYVLLSRLDDPFGGILHDLWRPEDRDRLCAAALPLSFEPLLPSEVIEIVPDKMPAWNAMIDVLVEIEIETAGEP